MTKTKIIQVLLLAAFLAVNSAVILAGEKSLSVLRAGSRQNAEGKYRVSVKESNPLLADVEAEISVKGGKLFMGPWGADYLPNEWASFVKNLRITDNAGKDLAFEPKPNGAWQLRDVKAGLVRLSYQVDLSFTKSKWKFGNEQAGIYQAGALFVVSKAVFIVSDNLGACRITFDVPASEYSSLAGTMD